MTARALLLLLVSAALAAPAYAQLAPADSVRVLDEVVVGGVDAWGPGVERVPVAGVLARDPERLADVVALLPSATAPTNSRGETLLYLRGVGERQTAVLLDGAPLTVPWDRRLDLGLVPAGSVGALEVVRGPASLAWGPNAAGGSLALVPRTLVAPGSLTEAEVSGGLPARGHLSATYLRRGGPWQGGLAVDAFSRVGDALAGTLPFSQPDGALRTNTDRRAASALARAVYESAPATVSLTALHLSAAQGVAPEGHLDPAVERVRFWRIPDWRQTSLVARVRAARLDATAWGSLFAQTIRPFDSAAYAVAAADQRDDDRTAGARATASVPAGPWTLRGIAHGLVAVHRQSESEAVETFRHTEGRLAVEAEGPLGPLYGLVGGGLDVFTPVETAGRGGSDTFRALALTARVAAPVGPAEAHAGVARAARFPTMRELFGEALGRFTLNPDLRPETTWQAEVGAHTTARHVEARAVVFARWTDGAIEQEVLPDGRRRRANLGGSRAVGVEADASLLPRPHLRLDASATLLHLRGWTDGDATRLPERPAALGRLAATALPSTGWTGAVEALATGPAVSLGRDGLLDLPATVRLNGRVGYRWAIGGGRLHAFLRVDNAMDVVSLPQAGLPAPGREIRAGLRWAR